MHIFEELFSVAALQEKVLEFLLPTFLWPAHMCGFFSPQTKIVASGMVCDSEVYGVGVGGGDGGMLCENVFQLWEEE